MIDFEHVSKQYKHNAKPALEDVNFHVDDGEFVFLLGHSGAGKSTLLKLILREETPTEGRVLVNGQDVARLRRRKIPYLRRQMGIIFQDFRLIPTMTVYENIAFAMHVTNIGHKQIKERVNYMLELVHLEDKAKVYPDLLSGGEQQRVAVARALAHAPKLVIADEPTGNIDPELSLEMMELLERVSEMGITVLVVTHEHELVRHFDRRVVTLSGGHIISDVPTGSMIPHPARRPEGTGNGGVAGMMKPSTFGFLVVRGVRNLGKHWAMTIACIASLSVCMTLNTFATLAEVNVDSMVNYLGQQNEMVVYVDPEADDATIQTVGERITATPGVSRVQYMSKEDVLNQYRGYMADYAVLLDEFENDNPFKANYRVSLADLSQMQAMSQNFQSIPGVYSVTAPIEMTQTFVEVQRAVTKVGQIVILVLMAVSIITVGSTIRLSVFARRREIEIMKYVGATNHLVTLPFFVEGLTMGLISGAITSVAGIFGYAYIVQASSTLGGLWQLLMGTAMVPVDAVWPTILTYSLAGGALVGALGSMFSIRKHLNV